MINRIIVSLLITALPTCLLAQAAAHPNHPQNFMSSLPMLLAFVFLFYFLLIRPQTQRAKEHRSLLEKLAVGDEIVTTGGLAGRVESLSEAKENLFITVTLAKDIRVTIKKEHVANVLPKGTLTLH